MQNYIDIAERHANNKIYRVITIDRLIEMFEKQVNTLVKPGLWDDPFENFILNIPVESVGGKSHKSSLRDRAYGQCWTKTVESDAMWRIYAPQHNGVKIRTTVKKLFTSLYNHQKKYPNISCFIGEVKYYSKNDIDELVADRLELRNRFKGSIGQARAFLFKRNAFKHESEIRLIYLQPNNKATSSVYSYPCDVNTLIDGITFDPRTPSSIYNIYRKHLIDMGFRGKIVRSGLYQAPNYS